MALVKIELEDSLDFWRQRYNELIDYLTPSSGTSIFKSNVPAEGNVPMGDSAGKFTQNWIAFDASLLSNANADLLDGQHGAFYQDSSNQNAGTLPAARLPAHTGDVTSSIGTVALTIAPLAVTVGKLGNLAVTTAKIDNLAVTPAKVAGGTYAISISGNAATASSASSATSATTAASCSGNAATATTATNASNLNNKAPAFYIAPTGTMMMYAGALTTGALRGGWVLCDGTTHGSGDTVSDGVDIYSFAALVSLLGSTYGAAGKLPDMRGRVGLGVGTATGAPGATAHTRGQVGGEEKHTLTTAELAAHQHFVANGTDAGNQVGTISVTGANTLAATSSTSFSGVPNYTLGGTATAATLGLTSSTGSATPLNVLNPYVGINYIIKL